MLKSRKVFVGKLFLTLQFLEKLYFLRNIVSFVDVWDVYKVPYFQNLDYLRSIQLQRVGHDFEIVSSVSYIQFEIRISNPENLR